MVPFYGVPPVPQPAVRLLDLLARQAPGSNPTLSVLPRWGQGVAGFSVPSLGAAGLSLSLASGAPASTGGPPTGIPTQNTGVSQEITFGEEEISDVSLATFYVFDKENPRTFSPGVRLAGHGGGGGCGCGGGGGC